jgi:hypothetical protein
MESGIIRKIVIGPDPKNAMAYYVGMKLGDNTVSHIVLDDYAFSVKGIKRYLVYVSTEEGTELWKGIEDMPCIVEYNLDF